MTEIGRDKVLRAALELFGRDGVAGTTLSRLRQASGVSVGSFYHHFSGKEEVVEALFVECIALYQSAFIAELRRHEDPRAGVAAVVAFHIRWCMEHPHRARFLFTERRPGGGELAERNRAFFGEVLAWWRTHVHHGALAELDLGTAFVLWLGPAQELCRLWLNGEIPAPGDDQIARLGRAAWRSLEREQR
ncbi:TetR/AcrR family transcriptional regulator [Actinomadura rudentiformis]|uniref:TetR/AcrR family transcriptional regulator n=1 Tax=Actinomadura rudentiformis TaxID=359158 RepID=A0A6H9YEK2_9ACTN|nr:TetR/AcrR family transcriptional regulator [Actinomadura rudentiformis]KAB2344334.1 TetR/AcrR family transcriptional regulator [Actinomadura rudentiformis]